MPGIYDVLEAHIKKRDDARYRFVDPSSVNISEKKARGYNIVRSEDPEVKGTILERDHKTAEGHIKVGELVLARISEKDAKAHQKKLDERVERRLQGIKRTYEERGEDIKRELGSRHKDFKTIVKTEE